MSSLGHLARRFITSLSRREPPTADAAWAVSQMLEGERELWSRLPAADRRHAIVVARRFESMSTQPWSRDELAGALLHDVGKLESGLGTYGRVVATIVGPRTTRFRRYHDHERLGAELLEAAGSSLVTIDLVRGRGRGAPILREADDI